MLPRLPITAAQALRQKVYHCPAANVYAASATARGGHSGRTCGCKAEQRSPRAQCCCAPLFAALPRLAVHRGTLRELRLLTKEKIPQAKRCKLVLVPGDCAGDRDHHCGCFKKAPASMVDFVGPQSRPCPSRSSGAGTRSRSRFCSTRQALAGREPLRITICQRAHRRPRAAPRRSPGRLP